MEININTLYGNCHLQVLTHKGIIKKSIITKLPQKRNLLKNTKDKPILDSVPYIERIDPNLSLHHSYMYINAIETDNNITISDNLNIIRKLFLNLEKIKTNLEYFYKNIKIYNMHWHKGKIIRYYENILKLQESITGRRFFSNLLAPGGLNLNLTLGKIKKLKNINFTLDKINLYLELLSKDLKSFNDKNLSIFKTKIFATRNYIQDYISLTNYKILPIKPYIITSFNDSKNIISSIYTPRGNANIDISIKNNTISKIELKTASEININKILKSLNGSNIDEIVENINIYDFSLLELSQ